MNKSVFILLGCLIFASLGQASDAETSFEIIQKVCFEKAKKEAAQAARDAVNVPAAFGGNISSGLITSIEEATPHFIFLYTSLCQADQLRALNIQTPYNLPPRQN